MSTITYTINLPTVHNFLPIFLYDFIGVHMGIVYGMVYGVMGWCYGLVVADIDSYDRRGRRGGYTWTLKLCVL